MGIKKQKRKLKIDKIGGGNKKKRSLGALVQITTKIFIEFGLN